ncbi:MAG: UDP-N-acetylmuramoyl-L-alanine--D-glutamate ligase [Candidatus Moraniibacteriota bacterium]|nr:MAG: UDP-N-acetylmuramoyl-L-alanine--D-glutamate ligase [Candidatus Moranbacteria bacterium]
MLKSDWFKGKRITVFGIGLNRGALATIKFLIEAGVREVIATDIKTKEDLAPTIRELAKYKNITYVLGQHRSEDFTQADMVVKNPVIAWTNEYIKLALTQHVPVEMDASLFIQLTKRPMIGITGTKGKTTTASLIAHILEQSGKEIVRAGISQIGFLDALAQLTRDSAVVAELSSWRLSSFVSHAYSPSVAVVTNIYPDHLNYYKKMAAYVADKEVIFRFQKQDDWLILNCDNEGTRAMALQAKSRIVWFSEHELTEGEGVFFRSGTVYERTAAGEQLLFPWPEVALRGEHNRSNILAAIAAARTQGVSPNVIRAALATFRGVPHRLELVGEREGVRYFNDTAATMPEAAMAGIRAFTAPVVLIAGGADKAFDYAELARVFATEPKAVVLFQGTATEKLLPLMEQAASAAGKSDVLFPVVASMEDALRVATDEAEPGDVVLLSPGVASFGLFQNEFDRGDQFRSGVQRLLAA